MFDSVSLQQECLDYKDDDKPTFQDLFNEKNSKQFQELDFGINPVVNDFQQFIQFDRIEVDKICVFDQNKPLSTESSQKQAGKLDYHNFQKHLVLCLKKIFNIGSFVIKYGQSLENKLWGAFQKSNKMTKELMSLTFGSQQDCNKICFKKYGFEKIYQTYSQQEIKCAQKNIQIEILKTMKAIQFDVLIEERRIKQKQNFKTYLSAFVKGLEQGTFFRRLPSLKRKEKKSKN